jgi:hypothetical protein
MEVNGMRSLLALILVMAVSPARGLAQTSSSERVYKQLSKIAIHSNIEIERLNGTRVQGELVSYDRVEVTVAGQSAPIPLAEVKSVKRLGNNARWNPIWGLSGSWKFAVIGAAIVIVVGVIAAKGTR